MRRRGSARRQEVWAAFAVAALALAALGLPQPGAAQLRPLDPLDWADLGQEGRTVVVGGGLYRGVRASLAGTEGRLWELGTFRATWGLDRVAVELSGTAARLFDDRVVYADPAEGVRAPDGSQRRDVGDYRVSTAVRLTPRDAALGVALRFGVRLPTTDDARGLGRDQTDFFSLLAARVEAGPWEVAAEAGVGILGTRDPTREQIDPFLYSLTARYASGSVRPFVELVGQHDPRTGPDRRGTENLGEARLGVRTSGTPFVRVAAVRGWTRMGPDLGMDVRLGWRF